MPLLNHQMPPYQGDLSSTVKQALRQGHCEIDPDSLVIPEDPEYLGSGAWGDAYKIQDVDGIPYALKLFHSSERMGLSPDRRDQYSRRLLLNAWEQRDLLAGHSAFTNLYGVSHQLLERFTLSEFVQGENVREAIQRGVDYSCDPQKVGRMLLQVTDAMKYVHGEGKLMFDVGWHNIIENNGNIKICDNDAIELNERKSVSGDIEWIALMVDEIIHGTRLPEPERYDQYATPSQEHSREYPWERRAKLPPQLRDIVPALLHRHRNDTITIDAMIYTIRSDFGV